MTLKHIVLILAGLLILAACKKDVGISLSDLPETRSAEHGAELFDTKINGTPACTTCHTLTDVDNVGPGMAGFGDLAGTRVKDENAEEYIFNSITRPAKYLVNGFSNVMYSDYAKKLSPQDIADLIAYLLTL